MEIKVKYIIFVIGLMWLNYPQTAYVQALPFTLNSERYLILNKMNKEIWKDIKGYEGYYQVSNLGRIKSLTRSNHDGRLINGIMLKTNHLRGNYRFCTFCKNTHVKRYSIHRLVSQSFIPNPENKTQVNHKDGNKLNNHVDNLEWCTPSENMKHAYRTGLLVNAKNMTGKFGNLHHKSKPIIMMGLNNVIVKEYESISMASVETKIYRSNIHKVLNNDRNHAGGYKWKYKE